ncbi:helix-turn-helix transcriptional regulator [Streptomyces sp. RB6PN25]|uniref:Helix-turn-helix transcriptional regulator n=1 Tax=Streptomyces humicola TaxID=2953240 RepID=A0ABT1Q3W2_9ACTN|nr:helix-turn-helix transcriptional regulator [Streptomyces humicola]MCQ4084627.1 helix-turn-helix transcriptional regulator [Streptomyces humicola]
MTTEHHVEPAPDPTSSTLAFFGSELRLRREAAGLSQTELARLVHCAPSLLSKIESAKRVPKEDMAELCDCALGTDGFFGRLWPVMIRNAYPAWFRPFVDLEQQAVAIRSFEMQFVPGLLQTEEYARAILAGGRPDSVKLEELVVARMHRQRVLSRDDPPRLWVILDETAIRRRIGGAAVMRAQLARLLEAAQIPRIVVQVVPFDVRNHPVLTGAFWTFSFDEGPDVVHMDSFYEGQLRAEPEVVAATHHAYDLLRALALSPEASADLIASAIKDLSP